MSITARERDTYAEVWGSVEAYSSPETAHPGLQYLPLVLEIMKDVPGRVLLDAGCGNGEAAVAYQKHGFRPDLLDLTREGLLPEAQAFRFFEQPLWDPIPHPGLPGGRYDIITCTDVLEHLPTQFTMLSVSRLLEVGSRVFLSIAHTPDVMGAWVGRPLHLTVESFTWWRDNLRELGRLVEARDLITTGLFVVEPF